MGTRKRERVASHERGSRNVYADLGYPDADDMLIKAQLVGKIAELIAERGYTQTQAAGALRLTQPELSKQLRGQFRGISGHTLMDYLKRLG